MAQHPDPQTAPKPKPLENRLKAYRYLAKRPTGIAVFSGFTVAVAVVLQAWFLAKIINGVAIEHLRLSEMHLWLGVLIALFIIRACFLYLGAVSSFEAGAQVKLFLRDQLSKKLLSVGSIGLSWLPGGDLVNTVTDGVETMDKYFGKYLPQKFMTALIPIVILVAVFPQSWVAGLILALTVPVMPLFMILVGKEAENHNQRQWRILARLSAHFLDVIQGLPTLKLFQAAKAEVKVVAQMSEAYRKATMKVLAIAFLSSLVLEFFATLGIALVAVFIGFRLLGGVVGHTQLLAGLFALILAPEFFLPFRSMGSQYHARMEAIGAADKIMALLDLPDAPVSGGDKKPDDRAGIIVTFDQVSFAYEKERPVLDNISFTLQNREITALVGPSGAGKTTVLNLVMGFLLPQSGRILINGSDLTEIDPGWWRSRLAYVPQNPRLFYGTLRENICLGAPEASEEEIREALHLSLADEFIDRLPGGLNTAIGDLGQGLSGGQRQRIALARAFLKKAPLVVLDEPTAGLDRENEKLIAEAVSNLLQNRTVFMIAHRLQTIEKAGQILVLEKGRLIEQGTHTALVARQGFYANLSRVYAGGEILWQN